MDDKEMSTLTDRREALLKMLVAGEWSFEVSNGMSGYKIVTPTRSFQLKNLNAGRGAPTYWVVWSERNSIDLGSSEVLDEKKKQFEIEHTAACRANKLRHESDILERWLA